MSPIPGFSYHTNCTNEPVTRQAFCGHHCKVMKKLGFQTTVQGFLDQFQIDKKKVFRETFLDMSRLNAVIQSHMRHSL